MAFIRKRGNIYYLVHGGPCTSEQVRTACQASTGARVLTWEPAAYAPMSLYVATLLFFLAFERCGPMAAPFSALPSRRILVLPEASPTKGTSPPMYTFRRMAYLLV
jgi:hypothetical protein